MERPVDQVLNVTISFIMEKLQELKNDELAKYLLEKQIEGNGLTYILATKKNPYVNDLAIEISKRGLQKYFDYIFNKLISIVLYPGEFGSLCTFLASPINIVNETLAKTTVHVSETVVCALYKRNPALFILRICEFINLHGGK